MEITKLKQDIDRISTYYCDLLSLTKNPYEKEKIFKTFHHTLNLIEKLHIDSLCSQLKNRKNIPDLFMED